MPGIHDSLSSIAEDAYDTLVSLNVHKSSGLEKISPQILKNCADVL